MNVLFVCDPNSTSNPYVHTLVEELSHQQVEARMSCDDLWTRDDYDIIHFQWPEAIYKWDRHVTKEQVSRLKKKILELKGAGKKVVLTCHNLKPHTNEDRGVNALYSLLYGLSDLCVHMGKYSYDLLSTQYPEIQHIIIPHHIYDHVYHFKGDKKTFQKELGVDGTKVNVLCFGVFRTEEERAFVLELMNRMRLDGINFMAPGFYRKHWYAKSVTETIRRICNIYKYKHTGLRFSSKPISNAMTEKYFTACDLVLIQRQNILNSGNLPMGFHAGKVVVGVNTGNVGCILRETGNPTFEAGHIDTAITAIHYAVNLTRKGLGNANREFAEREWSTEAVAKKLTIAYKNL